MDLVYNGYKYTVYSKVKIPKAIPDDEAKGYLYFIRIGEIGEETTEYKIGTSCRVLERMTEHARSHKKNIYVLWVSPKYSKWTTLRVEAAQKKIWREMQKDWTYKRQDRFIIPSSVREVSIHVSKDHNISLY